MSEFLLVIPEGWTQIDLAAIGAVTTETSESLATMTLSTMTELLREHNFIGPDDTVIDSRVFNHSYLLIRLG